jgi:hypothetical protein
VIFGNSHFNFSRTIGIWVITWGTFVLAVVCSISRKNRSVTVPHFVGEQQGNVLINCTAKFLSTNAAIALMCWTISARR